MNTADQFWSRVAKADGCWIFGNPRHSDYVTIKWRGRYDRAHRIAYRLATGPIAPRNVIMHKCDNPQCVRPDHLRQGSPRSNQQDSIMKGRGNRAFGERVAGAKLTSAAVREIRAGRHIRGHRRLMAIKYGVDKSVCSRICTGQAWRRS